MGVIDCYLIVRLAISLGAMRYIEDILAGFVSISVDQSRLQLYFL